MLNKSELYKNICISSLHKKSEAEYGATYREHFLEQYKIVIQGVDYTSKWKHIVNNYFLTMHTVLLAGVGLSASRADISLPVFAHSVVPVIGICLAISWLITARGYNDVLATKFSILHCIEEHLPMALYKTEWDILSASYKNPHRAARVDSMVPAFFIILYSLIFIFMK